MPDLFRPNERAFDQLVQRRWPSLIPNALAFWRNEPTVRFMSLEIFFTRILSFEYRLSSATSVLVQATRFVRRRFAFLAIRLSMSLKLGGGVFDATIRRLWRLLPAEL